MSQTWGARRTDRTSATLLWERAADDASAPYITFGEGEPITRGEMLAAATMMAGRLRALGVGRGDTVATLMEPRREITECWFACALLGAVFMPLNTALRGAFLAHPLRTSEAMVLVTDRDRLPQALAVLGSKHLATIVVMDDVEDGTSGAAPADVRLLGPRDWSTLDAAAVEPDAAGRWNEPALILFTSGTTGLSKAVVLSHHYVMHMAELYAASLGMRAGDVFYGPLPMHHLSGTIVASLCALTVGGSSVVDPVFSVSRFWPRIRETGATHTVLVGGMPQMLWQRPPDREEQDNPLRAAVVIPLDAEVHHAFEERFGLKVVTGYGSSEAGQITFSSADAPARPGSAGRPVDSYDVQVVDDEDEPVAVGEVGEIIVRPRVPHVMFDGYRGNPEATAAATRNLWFHTGDLGYFDEAGNLTFADRKKDYIRRRGENISSFEVENALLSHPGVLEAAAIGVPSELGEDEVKVCVVLRPDAGVDEVELLRYAAATMPYFAVPRYIALVDSLPRSAVGRIQKFVLRDEHRTSPGWDRDEAGYRLTRHNIERFVADPHAFRDSIEAKR